MNVKKTFKIAIAVVMLIAIVVGTQIAGWAADPTYNMSSDYKNGRYYENFKAVELVGDGARDTLAIALSQLGYHEGNDDGGRNGLSTDGDRDFVEYNVLYGKLDNDQGNGLSYGYYWCASFVNWCLRQAEVSKNASAAAEVSCRRWLSAAKEAGIYSDKDGYIPKSADLIFFKEADSLVSSTHMGIVVYCEENRVYTIEGNTSNGSEFSTNGNYVALKSYPLTSSYIVGYATPNYNVVEGIGELDYSGKTFGAGQYISTDVLTIYSDSTYSAAVGKIEAFTVFDVESVIGNSLYVDGGCIKVENVKQITAENDMRSVAYLNSAGKKIYSNQYAEKGNIVTVTEEIPERSAAAFIGWSTGDKIIYPGDELALDESIRLYAVYDDTKPPAEQTTESKTLEITSDTEEISTASTTDFEEDSATATTDLAEVVQTESDERDSEELTGLQNEGSNLNSNHFGCRGQVDLAASLAIFIPIAVSGLAIMRKTKEKDIK